MFNLTPSSRNRNSGLFTPVRIRIKEIEERMEQETEEQRAVRRLRRRGVRVQNPSRTLVPNVTVFRGGGAWAQRLMQVPEVPLRVRGDGTTPFMVRKRQDDTQRTRLRLNQARNIVSLREVLNRLRSGRGLRSTILRTMQSLLALWAWQALWLSRRRSTALTRRFSCSTWTTTWRMSLSFLGHVTRQQGSITLEEDFRTKG